MVMPAKSKVSELTNPERLPLPYRISKEDPFCLYEEEADESYLAWRKHAIELHFEEGIQRLELPVSRMTLKSWGGVPRLISA
jgi:hypothetical protein